MYHPEAEHGEPVGVLKPLSRQEQPARSAHQPPVRQRNRQRTEFRPFLRGHAGERGVKAMPPGGFPVQRGQQVGQLRERHPAYAEHRPRRMPERPGHQVGQHRR